MDGAAVENSSSSVGARSVRATEPKTDHVSLRS
jgi:hypothetical protein